MAPAGTYTVTATDANGCTGTVSVTITQPTAVTVTITSNISPLCFGGTGTATASASGGTGTKTYKWNNSSSTTGPTLTASAGTYTVTATDSHGCTGTAAVTITQPLAVTVTITSNNPALCFGQNGSATASAIGGTGTKTYKWNNSSSTVGATLTASAGTYTVTATDANGCTGTAAVTITQPASAISVTITSNIPALCFGANGSATASASGGTGALTYSWNDANSTVGTSLSAIAGTYTVTVTDANGCTGTASVTITQPASTISVTITSNTPALCFGANGSATASASGGTGALTYSWNDANSTVGTSLTAVAGSYTVTVTDANGCNGTAAVTITQPASTISVTITSNTPALCFGGNGSATASASGGTGALTYQWNNASSTTGVTVTATAGTYTVTVTDANGCTGTTAVTISQPASAVSVIITSVTNATCIADGSATASASGGTGIITYRWNDANSSTGATLTAIAGTYTVTATDANGCTATASATIGQTAGLSTTITILAEVTCNATATGNAIANIIGGASPYTYSWSNGTSTVSTSNPTGAILPAHAYTVKVTDKNGCIATAAVTITQPVAIRDSIINVTNATCANNGIATLGVKYGTPPYTYLWTPGGMTTATVTNLGAQTYTATVTDNHGCTGTARHVIISNSGSSLRDSISVLVHVGCNGGNGGGISVGTRGGFTPYTYSWSNGATIYNVSNLTAGSYTVAVTDNHGCTNTLSATITQPATALVVTRASITYPQCHGEKGTASVSATGGTPTYKYAWVPNVSSTASSTNLTAGTYTVTVSDAHGCKATVTINMTQPNAIRDTIIASSKVNVSCNGGNNGSATIGLKYATSPYTYLWSNGQTTAHVTGLSAGVYTLTVTDIKGCSGTASMTITQPSAALSAVFGAVTCTSNLVKVMVQASGGTSPYTYLWSPGGGTKATMSNLAPGTYTVSVTDAHGCNISISQNLVCPPSAREYLSGPPPPPECCGGLDNIVLYPNPNSGQFTLTGLEAGMSVEMYDYTGRKVYTQVNIQNSTFNINIADQPNGIYLLRMLDNNGTLVSKKKVVKTQ